MLWPRNLETSASSKRVAYLSTIYNNHSNSESCMSHITVLKAEAIHLLNLKKGSVVVDCTLGSGGHAHAILSQLGPQGVYVGIDADPTAIAKLGDELGSYKAKVHLVQDNFKNLQSILDSLSLPHADAILADLGWRMEQFDGSSGLPRGFSFSKDEPLEMTYGDPKDYSFTAKDIVNDWAEEDIANVIFGYGEDRFARRIARTIIDKRTHGEILTSKALSEIVYEAVPAFARRGKAHPATKTFQALRIAVNDEFDTLSTLLSSGLNCLSTGGRMAIITFHSLEDRIVKQTFRSFLRDQQALLVHKKPIAPSREELLANPRARSAKLRTIEKI